MNTWVPRKATWVIREVLAKLGLIGMANRGTDNQSQNRAPTEKEPSLFHGNEKDTYNVQHVCLLAIN